MKKLISVIMALAIMLSMGVVSFAATTLPAPVDGVITLTEDVELGAQLVIETGETVVINLNGHKLTTYAVGSNYDVVVKGNLTINGEGSVHISGVYGFGLSSSGTGTLTINGGNFTSSEDTYYMIGGFGGKVTIKDGSFTTPYCVINSFDGYDCVVEIHDGDFTVTDENDETAATLLGGDNNDYCVMGGTFSDTLPTEYLFPGKIQDGNGNVTDESSSGSSGSSSAPSDESSSGSSSAPSEDGSSGSSSAPSSRPSRDDDDDDDDEGITDIVPGNKEPEGEENPNTGAPIMLPIATAVAALCGLYISKKK